MRILVIEDEPRMLDLLRRGLQERDCAVMTAVDGETGLEIAADCEFDVILLDNGLPGVNGYEVVQSLRERAYGARVLMLTARDGEDDIIRGLDLGADDYMTKPFSFPELIARLQSLSRRRRCDENRVEVGDLKIDLVKRSVTRGNRNIDLSRSEFNLLLSLIRSAEQSVSRQNLMEGVWGSTPDVGPGALDVLVNSLRSKIDAPHQPKLIHTVRGFGYILTSSGRIVELARQ
jgi:DNA-binding response OmpR family regulator